MCCYKIIIIIIIIIIILICKIAHLLLSMEESTITRRQKEQHLNFHLMVIQVSCINADLIRAEGLKIVSYTAYSYGKTFEGESFHGFRGFCFTANVLQQIG